MPVHPHLRGRDLLLRCHPMPVYPQRGSPRPTPDYPSLPPAPSSAGHFPRFGLRLRRSVASSKIMVYIRYQFNYYKHTTYSYTYNNHRPPPLESLHRPLRPLLSLWDSLCTSPSPRRHSPPPRMIARSHHCPPYAFAGATYVASASWERTWPSSVRVVTTSRGARLTFTAPPAPAARTPEESASPRASVIAAPPSRKPRGSGA